LAFAAEAGLDPDFGADFLAAAMMFSSMLRLTEEKDLTSRRERQVLMKSG
jgi:hypothetical protein